MFICVFDNLYDCFNYHITKSKRLQPVHHRKRPWEEANYTLASPLKFKHGRRCPPWVDWLTLTKTFKIAKYIWTFHCVHESYINQYVINFAITLCPLPFPIPILTQNYLSSMIFDFCLESTSNILISLNKILNFKKNSK